MGRAKPLNGTVGITKPRLQEVKEQVEAGNAAAVMAFIYEAIAVCESEEYTVLTGEDEE